MPRDYEVGYKNPPVETQFKRGESGNPKGRPKGTKNFRADLQEELAEQILIHEGTKERHVSKQRAMLKSLMAKAVKGDTRAATLVLNMVYRLLEMDAAGEEEDLTAEEQAVLETFEAGILRRAQKK